MMGTTIEWYDFFLYGTAAALVFNKIFFPAIDPISGTLAAFATYSVGFFAARCGVCRPLRRQGRTQVHAAHHALHDGHPHHPDRPDPSYDSIGYWAAVLLVLMRFLQGVAVGGEWGGAILMAVEHAPEGKKGFFGSLPQTGVAPGLILSSLAMGAVAALPEEDMLSWGWRIPFLASVVLLLVGWFIRAKVAESPDFERMREQGDKVEVPALVVLRRYPREVLIVVGGRLAEVTWFYTVVTFSLAYATGTLGIRAPPCWMPPSGARRWRCSPCRCAACWATASVSSGSSWPARRASCCSRPCFLDAADARSRYRHDGGRRGRGPGLRRAVRPARRPVLGPVPPEVRYSGISLAVQVSGAIGGGLAPLVATSLLATAAATPLHCLVPERAGPGRHRQRVLHAPAHALRAAGRRPPEARP